MCLSHATSYCTRVQLDNIILLLPALISTTDLDDDKEDYNYNHDEAEDLEDEDDGQMPSCLM